MGKRSELLSCHDSTPTEQPAPRVCRPGHADRSPRRVSARCSLAGDTRNTTATPAAARVRRLPSAASACAEVWRGDGTQSARRRQRRSRHRGRSARESVAMHAGRFRECVAEAHRNVFRVAGADRRSWFSHRASSSRELRATGARPPPRIELDRLTICVDRFLR